MYTIFRTFSSQYSRQLLSILAQQPTNKKKQKTVVLTTSLPLHTTTVNYKLFKQLHSCATK